MEFVLFCFVFSSSRYLTGGFILRRPVGSLLLFVSPVERLAGLHFPLFFDAKSLLFHWLLRGAHHSDGSIVVFWSYSHLQRSCGLSVTGAWLSHAWEILFLNCTWRSRSVFFPHAKVVPGDREANMVFGKLWGWRVPYTGRPLAMTVTLLPAWVDFLLDVCLCIPLFLCTVCLCMAQILLIFFYYKWA